MNISIKREQNNACIGSAEREKYGAKLKTKNIFKTLAAAMLMPAMLLTASCSSEDEFASDGTTAKTETIAKQGYPMFVTVNVTRQGDDAATRTTYNESTRKLAFSAGDKLFMDGYENPGVGEFAGTLDYVSDGTFSGTIYTEKEFTGNIDDLITVKNTHAVLLPAGYEGYGYLSINDNETEYKYDDYIASDYTKAFALTKAEAVEQFSEEFDFYDSDTGYALAPYNAILNFTITGLPANTNVTATLEEDGESLTISGNVTTDASGTATFAIGIEVYTDLNDYTLTVGGKAITLVSESKEVEAGKIYNISRSAAPALAEATAEDLGKIAGADGKIYDTKAAAEAVATGNAVAMIAYVGSETDHATYKHGLAIALSDEGDLGWSTAMSTCEGKTPAVPNAVWLLPSRNQWTAMFKAFGNNEGSYTGLNTALATAGGDSSKLQDSNEYLHLDFDGYWSSTDYGDSNYPERVELSKGSATWEQKMDINGFSVRACLVF